MPTRSGTPAPLSVLVCKDTNRFDAVCRLVGLRGANWPAASRPRSVAPFLDLCEFIGISSKSRNSVAATASAIPASMRCSERPGRRMVLISRMPFPIYRSLPVIDHLPAATISVARSQSAGSEGRFPKGSSALRHSWKVLLAGSRGSPRAPGSISNRGPDASGVHRHPYREPCDRPARRDECRRRLD